MPEPSTPTSSPPSSPSIPIEAVEQLWEQLALTYGHTFLRLWEGFDHDAVRQKWAQELRGLTPAHFDYAMRNLAPGRPPQDVLEFRQIALRMPPPTNRFALPPKEAKGIPANIRAALQALSEPSDDTRPEGVRWAAAYVARWAPVVKLTPFQQQTLAHARGVLRRWELRQAAAREQQRKTEEADRAFDEAAAALPTGSNP